jgi:tRNA(Arg) A34 adenosine deaminase TadA
MRIAMNKNDPADHVARELLQLLKTADPTKPFAAAIYSFTEERIVAQAINQELALENPIAHAEINTINGAAKTLFHAKNHSPDENLCIFVSTRPCPMCTAAIIEAGLFDLRVFYDNNYRAETARSIVAAKQSADRQYTFKEIDSRWKSIFQAISERRFRDIEDMARAVEYALAHDGDLESKRVCSSEAGGGPAAFS